MNPDCLKIKSIMRGLVRYLILGICMVAVSGLNAQTDSSQTESSQQDTASEKAATAQEVDTAERERQKLQVKEIYQRTQSARTAKDYTELLEKCDVAIAQSLNSKNQAYVVSLKGWALNRRGGKRFELARQLKRIGNAQHREIMEKALKDFDDAIVADPTRHRSFMSRGIAHMALYSAKSETTAETTGDSTKDPDVPVTVKPNLKRAILDFTTVTELKADEVNAWFNRAEAFYHFGAFEKSIEDYEVVLRFQPDDAQALTGRGHAKLAMGRGLEALVDYERVLMLQPSNAMAFINRGDALARLGKWEQSLADFNHSMEIEESGVVFQRLAWLRATCPESAIRNPAVALKMIGQAIELNGDSPTNLETLAAAEAANGDFDAAKSTQQKVIQLVGLAVEDTESPHQVRLMMYEKEEAYTQSVQAADDENEESKSADGAKSADETKPADETKDGNGAKDGEGSSDSTHC